MKTIYIVLFFTLTSLTFADNKITDVEAKYSSKNQINIPETLKQNINLGFSNTSGNTKTINLNGKYDLSFKSEGFQNKALKIIFDTSAFFTKNDNITSNEEYLFNFGAEQMFAKE
jgi:putative salt-induced outer membrane protein YdiY